ncbi:hypothetical protein SAMN04487838_1566 [Streptococcus equinus]|uniref:Uncharacterized protein n=1 Tax=Streptococcus equinus TaxID=1335 RepID=A0A1G9NCB8_STREI|nr:hypothetical protein SAMN05216400_1744 [Streptococcus equinus]SEK68812.1 hypothetical protein SAMN04487838_1566 [Streptococcus equinus]SEL25877.1 hypothetical protein SAMN05216373_1701 [Streptococcus equinus]SFG15638.1 hypothetical protein SAMN05216385_1565 [Streptococcus equinus]
MICVIFSQKAIAFFVKTFYNNIVLKISLERKRIAKLAWKEIILFCFNEK